MQRLLYQAVWDEDGARDAVRRFAVRHLTAPGSVLVFDETGQEKKGTATAGVGRQYTGTTGQVSNAVVAVYCTYEATDEDGDVRVPAPPHADCLPTAGRNGWGGLSGPAAASSAQSSPAGTAANGEAGDRCSCTASHPSTSSRRKTMVSRSCSV